MNNVKPMETNNDTVTLTFEVTKEESKLSDTELIYLASVHYDNPGILINWNVNGGIIIHRGGKITNKHFVQITLNVPPEPRPQDQRF